MFPTSLLYIVTRHIDKVENFRIKTLFWVHKYMISSRTNGHTDKYLHY